MWCGRLVAGVTTRDRRLELARARELGRRNPGLLDPAQMVEVEVGLTRAWFATGRSPPTV